ncbi:MAG: AAA family ATPase [Acetobacter malorum]|uniref:AAA family ATPase n=2 Tax=Acetobacter malorum TaxID=178901 RepID=UPI0039E94A5E
MTVRFVRLRIVGFKSFAEPVTVEILPGLTGIVGPNGCGKSNVVEALRWVMGESSARSLRGGEMDDLIFAGTAGRPARSLAEVTVTLEGTQGRGPAAFADQDELQITRRAERGSGSEYRINGKPARARDVQTLFADLASGARSSAMVSQGRVAMLVGARPEERRSILEEAAGITGLHARRHEAELKLRATENNLTRAEDLRQQLEARLGGLAEQSREASRYRELSSALRETETELLAVLHARARQAVERAIETTARARHALTEHEEAAESAVVAEFEANQKLPAIRARADEARTVLERCRVTAEGVTREEERAAAQAKSATDRLHQHEADTAAAQTRVEDATSTLERLNAEKAEAEEAEASLPHRTADAETKQTELTDALAESERTLAQQTETLAAARARKQRATEDLDTATTSLARASDAVSTLQAELNALQERLPSDESMEAAVKAVQDARAAQAAARTAFEDADRARSESSVALSIARNDAENARQTQAETRKALERSRAKLNTLRADLAQLEKRHADTQGALLEDAALQALRDKAAQATTSHQTAARTLEETETTRRETSAALTQASRNFQEQESHRKTVESACSAAQTALHRARQEEETLTKGLQQAQADALPDDTLKAAQTARATQEDKLRTVTDALSQAEAALTDLKTRHNEALTRQNTLRTELTRLQAQAEGLAQALGTDATGSDEPVSARMEIPEGYEAALAAALSEGLDAPVAENAARGWHALPASGDLPALPGGAVSLKAHIKAPEALDRVLACIGLLPDGVDGRPLQAALKPGQSLVSRKGDLWRWDGFYTRAGEPDAATRRLGQRRILKETEQRIATLQEDAPESEQAVTAATTALREMEQQAADQRTQRAKLEQALQQARTQEADLERRHAASRARLDGLRPQQERAVAARKDADAALTAATTARDALPQTEALKTALDQARQKDTAAQQAEQQARTALKMAEQHLRSAQDALTRAENQQATASARLETLLPERDRLRQDVAAEESALTDLESRLAAGQADKQIEEVLQASQTRQTEAEAACRTAEQAAVSAESAAQTAAQQHQKLQELSLELRSRLAALSPRLETLQAEQAEAEERKTRATSALQEASAALPESGEEELTALREKRSALTTELEQVRELRAALQAEKATLASKQASLTAAVQDWTARAEAARTDLTHAQARLEAARTEHQTVSELPAEAERLKKNTLQALTEAETTYAEADKARAEAETALADANEQRRKTEAQLTAARENLLKAEARSEQAQAILDQLLVETPAPPRPPTGDLTEAAESALRRKISRLTREREEMGPVNLRAEIEADEASGQANTLAAEIADLEAAIARLRGSIGSLNKEGRERLMAVFTQVDQHFQSLFSRMFGGGRAHLGLVGSDDPLEAGLEIYAQPPGKKLATLSLLSGGEQALTALSLIFAVFRCNPAPVCVLDEVDAPLDDANVGRFSSLLGDMVTEAGTRFLVVTHHQLTMAHMDHLFGVTMQERGVSRVLSVDLARAAAMAGQQD